MLNNYCKRVKISEKQNLLPYVHWTELVENQQRKSAWTKLSPNSKPEYKRKRENKDTVIENDHLGDWSPERDCCWRLMF